MINSNEILDKIENSFKLANKGEEDVKILIRWWGIGAYIFFYIVVRGTIKLIDVKFVDIILSSIAVIYFMWHIYAVKKCSPKKPKLTKEEKALNRQKYFSNLPKAFMRKLFLQEPISKWNPIMMTIVVDLLFLLQFLGYILG